MIRLQQKDSLRAHFHPECSRAGIFTSSHLHIGISGSLDFLVLLGQAKRKMIAKQTILPTKKNEQPYFLHSVAKAYKAG